MPKSVKPDPNAPLMSAPGYIYVDGVVDGGNANFNGTFGQDGVEQIKIDDRSILSPLPKATRLSELPLDSVFVYNGTTWVMGTDCYEFAPEFEDNVDEKRYLTLWYKTLFAGGLWRALHKFAAPNTVIEASIMSSIPAKLFKLEGFAGAVKQHLKGVYSLTSADGSICITVNVKVKIVPEGIGSYWSLIYSDDPALQRYAGVNVVVADQGFMSLDAVHVIGGKYVADNAKSATNIGVESVARAVGGYILEQTGTDLPLAEVDTMIQGLNPLTGESCFVTVGDTPLNVGPVIHEAWSELARRAAQWLSTVMRGKNITAILLTGGGALMLAAYWPDGVKLPKPIVIPNAPRANVDGGWLYLLSIRQ